MSENSLKASNSKFTLYFSAATESAFLGECGVNGKAGFHSVCAVTREVTEVRNVLKDVAIALKQCSKTTLTVSQHEVTLVGTDSTAGE
ncbi:hypothetical protein EXN66_Car000319 [Channa argus]|uniref:Uncharacterized protein n=1 Tax=Channa argus TaxID=215402 RepID=A0A6G1QYJ5_CHAAH|nr:hypothetical protein EXN66_Car000319 [Channa argus]